MSSSLTAVAAALDRDRPLGLMLALSFLIGAAYCLWLFGFAFLGGRTGFWLNSRDVRGAVGADVSTALSGYYFFLRGAWHLPLFQVDEFGMPRGIAIIFTDSIPILALLGRLIYRATGDALNLFGWWIAACFILLGMSLTALVARLGQRSLAAALAATLIGLSMPPLLYRWGQPALMAHFEIVLALIFYVACKGVRRGALRHFIAAAALLVLALWTNPYIFVMVGAVVAAALVQAMLDRSLAPRAGAAVLLGLAVVVVTVMLLSGYFEPRGSIDEAGFGHYSLNLLSPFSPQMSGLFPGRRAFVLDATGGQYEGFSYLGAGLLLLALLAARSTQRSSLAVLRDWRRRIAGSWRRHACLWCVLLGFLALAVSNTVYLGGWNLGTVPLPAPLLHLLGVFRSSGRFCWPALYALAATAIVAAAARHPRAGAAVLLVAAFLQWLDAAPLRAAVSASAAAAVPPLIDAGAWRRAIARHHAIRVFPSFACLDKPPFTWTWSRQVAVELQLLAGEAGVATNTVYAGRGAPDCPAEAEAAAAFERPAPSELAVFFAEFPGFAALQAAAAQPGSLCRASAYLVLCSRDFTAFDPQPLLAASPAD